MIFARKLRTRSLSIVNLVTRIPHLFLFCISGIMTVLLQRVLNPYVDLWSRVDMQKNMFTCTNLRQGFVYSEIIVLLQNYLSLFFLSERPRNMFSWRKEIIVKGPGYFKRFYDNVERKRAKGKTERKSRRRDTVIFAADYIPEFSVQPLDVITLIRIIENAAR